MRRPVLRRFLLGFLRLVVALAVDVFLLVVAMLLGLMLSSAFEGAASAHIPFDREPPDEPNTAWWESAALLHGFLPLLALLVFTLRGQRHGMTPGHRVAKHLLQVPELDEYPSDQDSTRLEKGPSSADP